MSLMQTSFPSESSGATAPIGVFDTEASEVMAGLRSSVANVLAAVGGVRKPADLQKSFRLDWTLSWQLFQVAGSGGVGGSALSAGSNVPSRTSLKKFLEAAQSRGIESAKVERVWTEYERFERLVDTHAGDRTTFNSMVSAAAGMDEEWITADSQHRRNAFRAMSHAVGMQARAKHICGIFSPSSSEKTWDFAVVSGYVGLRMLRPLASALVFRMRIVDPATRHLARRQGLGEQPELGGGFLISEFSTKPLPQLRTRDLDAGWVVSELDRPNVGNLGATTLRFGTAYYNHPAPGSAPGCPATFNADVVIDKPVEVIISDALVKPGMMDGKPVPEVFLGNNHSDAPALPGDVVPLLGDYRVEMLGKGPDVLATPEVPDYPALIRSAAGRLGWDVEGYEVWRLRVEFPVYQATVRVNWSPR